MRVQLDPHTLERAVERGTDISEIEEVLRTGTPAPAKGDRLAKEKVFAFNRVWRNRHYHQKKVHVIYTQHEELVTTVTVYVFYGSWEASDDAHSLRRED